MARGGRTKAPLPEMTTGLTELARQTDPVELLRQVRCLGDRVDELEKREAQLEDRVRRLEIAHKDHELRLEGLDPKRGT